MILWRFLSHVATLIAFAIRGALEGQAPAREVRTVDVDCVNPECPNAGRTFLVATRRTACCASLQWIPSGKVLSRHPCGPASEVIFR